MTLDAARTRLAVAVEDLWDAVGELVLIALEDQPCQGSLAAADAFAEQVSELQGEVAAARVALAEAGEPQQWLPMVSTAVDAATRRYWQQIRAHRPVMLVRTATRRLGEPWPAWCRTVEASVERCESPIARAVDTARACWVETLPISSVPADAAELHTMHRRTS